MSVSHKYRAKRTSCSNGHSHASKKEAKRCDELHLMQQGRLIHDLEQQPRFPCIINGTRVCTYVADFAYVEGGRRTIEDVKGQKLPMYRLKKKLVEALYPYIKISEV